MYSKICTLKSPYIVITHECMRNREGFIIEDGVISSSNIDTNKDKYERAVFFGNYDSNDTNRVSIVDYVESVATNRAININRISVFVDEGQFFSEERIKEIKLLSSKTKVYVFALRSDYNAKMFSGSHTLSQLADKIKIMRRMCSQCGVGIAVFDKKVDKASDLNSNYKQVCFCCFYSINI